MHFKTGNQLDKGNDQKHNGPVNFVFLSCHFDRKHNQATKLVEWDEIKSTGLQFNLTK